MHCVVDVHVHVCLTNLLEFMLRPKALTILNRVTLAQSHNLKVNDVSAVQGQEAEL